MLNQDLHNSQPTPVKANKPFDPIGFLTRYLTLVLVLGGLTFLVLSPLLWKIGAPSYQASAQLKIDPVVPSLITKSEDPSIINYFHDFARTQVKRLVEFGVLADAISRLDDEQKAAYFGAVEDQDIQVELLRRQLLVRNLSRTHLLELTLQGPSPGVPAVLVNHIMDAYIDKTKRELSGKHINRLEYLDQKRSELLAVIGATEQDLKEKSGEILTASFSEDFNLNHHKAQWLQKAYVQGVNDRIVAENRFREHQEKNRELENLSLEPMVAEMVMNDQSIDFTSSWTYQELQKMRASIDGISKQNPDRQSVEKRMEAMRDYEQTLLEETYDEARTIINGKRDHDLKADELAKQADFEAALASEADLGRYLDEARQASATFSKGLIDATALKTQLGYHRDLLFRIDTRIHELKAEAKAPLRVTIESHARMPKNPTPSNKKKLLLALLVFSFGSVGGLFLGLDFLDNRIRTPKDMQHALGVPPVWPISAARVPFADVLRKDANSTTAKAIRSLAGRLYREYRDQGAKVFLFTGVDPKVGCSQLTRHCATALTPFSAKVLVIANGGQDLTGIASLQDHLNGNATLDQCITRDETRGIDILNASSWCSGPDSWQSFWQVLANLRNDYDLICIDAPPVLRSEITEYLASSAQVCVLITRGDSTQFRDLKRSVHVLAGFNIPAIAPVLNWGGPQRRMFIDQLVAKFPRWLTRLPIPVPGYGFPRRQLIAPRLPSSSVS